MPSYTSLRNEGNGRNYQSNFYGTLEQVISDWKADCSRQNCIWSILIEDPSGRVIDKFNPTNIIEEEKPVTKEFLNENLKPYNDLTREEKHTLLDAMIDGNCERYYEDGWFEAKEFDDRTHRVYRTKPKEYKKLDIPWQFIDEELKYAAMDENGDVYFYEVSPSWNSYSKNEWCFEGGEVESGCCLKLDTTGIVAEHSLTQRPTGSDTMRPEEL